MKRIGIVAALPGELGPLVRGWERRGKVFRGRIGEIEAAAVCAGMGSDAARIACETVARELPVDAMFSVGWAGSLSCGLKPPEACAVREVIDAKTGEHFATENGEGQRLVTLDHVAGRDEKRRLAQSYQAAVVDMEAASVAGFARKEGMVFYCFKAVTDGPNDHLPDFNRFTAADGRLRTGALLMHAAARPQFWPELWRLGKNSRAAAVELSNFIYSFFDHSQ